MSIEPIKNVDLIHNSSASPVRCLRSPRDASPVPTCDHVIARIDCCRVCCVCGVAGREGGREGERRLGSGQ